MTLDPAAHFACLDRILLACERQPCDGYIVREALESRSPIHAAWLYSLMCDISEER